MIPNPIQLVRGQRIKLSDLGVQDALEVKIQATGPQMPLFLSAGWLDAQEKALGEHALLFAGHTPKVGGLELSHSGPLEATFKVALSGAPNAAQKLSFTLAFDDRNIAFTENAHQLESGFISLNMTGSSGSQEVARYAFSRADFGLERTLMLAELYRKDGGWRMLISGMGFYEGMPFYLEHLGLSRGLLAPLDTLEAARNTQALPVVDGTGVAAPQEKPIQLKQVKLPLEWPGAVIPKLPSGLTKAVGMVLVKMADGNMASGTGFCISPGGHLLTCYHVIDDALEVTFRFEGEQEFRSAQVLISDENHDLALLWLQDGMGHPHWLPLEHNETPDLGDELGLLGYPMTGALGEGVSYSQGIINGVRSREGVSFLQIDTGAAPGSSGGPIFRRSSGKVLGMLHGGFNMGDRGMIVNLGVDLRNLWALGWVRE
jgi:S1-C subfamily serine protease